MARGRSLLLWLGIAAAIMATATGVAYLLSPELRRPPVGAFFGILAFLGASGLAAAALWQRRADAPVRTFVLVVLVALSAGYIAANTFALVVAGDEVRVHGREEYKGLPGVPKPFHWTGLAVGVPLYLVALTETSLVIFAGRRSREEHALA